MAPFNEDSFSTNFESMSMGTQFSDSSNEANVYHAYMIRYDQPPQNYAMGSSSANENYGMSSYSLSTQISYHVPYQMQGGFEPSTWVNLESLIHVKAMGKTQEIYA